ncbi:MAG TPA: hypothetical protein VHT91_05770 [Kofleriaceae bacterium]|nr:hypothetical protein [Kofleriaceae bacterium]
MWFSRVGAADRAHGAADEALERDAERIRGLIRCPKCQRCAPHAVAWSVVRMAPQLVLGLIIAISVAATCAAEWPHGIWTAPVLLAIAVAVASIDERRRWRQARDAGLEVSARPAPRPAGPGPTPRQAPGPVAGGPFRTPPASTVTPVVTARVEPATPIVPGDPADKPRFLV